MAIFYCQTAPLSRSAGRSAVAAAAYRSASELVDERTGVVHDYARRSGVDSADLVLPDGAQAMDRGDLWNQAEAAELRKDARTAREWIVALPAELGDQERRALALEFAGKLADRYRVGVDVAIHRPGREGDQRNHHAHLLTTTREIGPDGFGPKSDIELSDKARKARGLAPARKEIEAVRGVWADLANGHLERAGRGERIDPRSLKAQGIEDREPTRHLGPAATAVERKTREPSRVREDQQANAIAKAAILEQAAELRAIASEMADLDNHRGELERQRQTQQDHLAALRAERLATYGQPTPAAAPVLQDEAKPTPAPAARRDQAPPAVNETPAQPKAPAPNAEQVYTDLLKPILERRQAAARAEHLAVCDERDRYGAASRAHYHSEPTGIFAKLRKTAWERDGAALAAQSEPLRKREEAARKGVLPEVILKAAREELRAARPGVVEAAEAARQAREAQEQAKKAEKDAAAKQAIQNALLARDFKAMALGRESKRIGFTDQSEKWQAVSPELKARIEAYNKLPPEKRQKALERLTQGKAPQTAALVTAQRELSKSQSRGGRGD